MFGQFDEESYQQFQLQDENKEDSMLMEEEQFNQNIEDSYQYNPFQESNFLDMYSTEDPIQQEQEAHFDASKESTVELVQEVQQQQIKKIKIDQQPTKKIKIDRGQVETKNIAAFYARSIIKAIKKRKEMEISNQCIKAIKKIEDRQGNISLVALKEFLSKDEISKFSQSYLTSFEFIDDILSSSKQKDIDAPLKYLKNVYQGCKNPNSLQTWK